MHYRWLINVFLKSTSRDQLLQKAYWFTAGAWKSYLRVSLKRHGGLFLFYCNYDINDYYVPSLFYSELLQWWSEFRDVYDTKKEWQHIVWNNKEIRINNNPIFYSVCTWRHQILKSKTKEPLKVLSSSGIRGTKFIPVYNFPAQSLHTAAEPAVRSAVKILVS